ncbi:hypothetical protein GGF31_000848 [Allomyces arbusculus]|nr:hypothetical protein GGF31_000848 [Allomyces arbusculus]
MMLSPSSSPRAHPPSPPAPPSAPGSTGTTPANSPRLAFLASCLARARALHDDDEDSFISTDLTSDLSSAATDDEDFDLRPRSLRNDKEERNEEAEVVEPYWSHSGIDAYVRSTGAAMAMDEVEGAMLTAAVEAEDGEARSDAMVDGDGKYGMDDKDCVEGNEVVDDAIAVTDGTVGGDTMKDDGTNAIVDDRLVYHDAMTDHVVRDGAINRKGIEFVDDEDIGEDATTDEATSDDAFDPEAMADDDDVRFLADMRSFDDDSDRTLAGWAPYSAGSAAPDEFCAHPLVPAPDGVAPDPNMHKNDYPAFLLAPDYPTAHLDDTEDDLNASDDGTTAHDRVLPLPLPHMSMRGPTAPGRRHASWPLPAPPPAISTTVPRHVRFASGPRGASPHTHARRTASAPVALPPRHVAELIAAAAALDPAAAPGVYLSPLAGPRVAPLVLDGAWWLDCAVPGMGMASSESDPGSGSDVDGWTEAAVQMLGGPRNGDEDLGDAMSADDDDTAEDNGSLDPKTRAELVERIPAPSSRATSRSTSASGPAPRRRSRTTSSASASSTLPPYAAAARSRPSSPRRATLRTAAAAWFPDGLITAARVRAALRPPATSTPGGLRPVILIPRFVAEFVAVATVAAVTVVRVLAAAARSGAPVAWSTPTADRVLRLAAPFAAHLPVRLRRVVSVDGPKAQAIVAAAVAVLEGAVALGWAVDEERVERVEKVVLLGAAAW